LTYFLLVSLVPCSLPLPTCVKRPKTIGSSGLRKPPTVPSDSHPASRKVKAGKGTLSSAVTYRACLLVQTRCLKYRRVATFGTASQGRVGRQWRRQDTKSECSVRVWVWFNGLMGYEITFFRDWIQANSIHLEWGSSIYSYKWPRASLCPYCPVSPCYQWCLYKHNKLLLFSPHMRRRGVV